MAIVAKTEDKMDLGGFMQNFVLSNPFKDLPGITSKVDNIKQEVPDGNPQIGNSHVGNAQSGKPQSGESSPGSGGNPPGEDYHVVSDENGQVVDTPKAHVGSNVVFAAALKLQKVSGAHSKVQKWLKNNYMHEPSYPACKSAKEIATDVQAHFPHITNMTLSKIMTFTFPNCAKVTNISGFHGYKGLISKPQPEDYCHLDLLKAVSHCKLYGSISEASQLYGVPADSVASLYHWHPDLSSLPVHMSVAEELQRQIDPVAFSLHNEAFDLSQSSRLPQRAKRRTLHADFCDPETLVELENDPEAKRQILEAGLEGELTEVTEENQATFSLLRNLLKRPRPSDDGTTTTTVGNEPQELPLDLHTGIVVKTEPLDAGYGDCDVNKPVKAKDKEREKERHKRKNKEEKGDEKGESSDLKLRSEVQRLKSKINSQLARNQKQEVQLLLSQKEVLSLKSSICNNQVSFTELSQDFANLQDQFCSLNRKFKRALEQLEKDKEDVMTPPKKKSKRRTNVNGGDS